MSVAQLLQNASHIWKKKEHSGNTNLIIWQIKCNYAAHSAANTNANRSRSWPICSMAICGTCCKYNCKGWIVSSPPNKSKSIASPCQGPQIDKIKPEVQSMCSKILSETQKVPSRTRPWQLNNWFLFVSKCSAGLFAILKVGIYSGVGVSGGGHSGH